jgi:hypothetical protein
MFKDLKLFIKLLKSIVFCSFLFSTIQIDSSPTLSHYSTISDEQFDAISDYVITKPSLAEKLTTMFVFFSSRFCRFLFCFVLHYKTTHLSNRNAFNWTIVGYPVVIQNEKYHRNALMFNVCMLFDRVDNYARSAIRPYEPLVAKLAKVLRTLEV